MITSEIWSKDSMDENLREVYDIGRHYVDQVYNSHYYTLDHLMLALLDNKRAVEILMTAINAPEDRKKKFLVSYKSRIGQKIKSMGNYDQLDFIPNISFQEDESEILILNASDVENDFLTYGCTPLGNEVG